MDITPNKLIGMRMRIVQNNIQAFWTETNNFVKPFLLYQLTLHLLRWKNPSEEGRYRGLWLNPKKIKTKKTSHRMRGKWFLRGSWARSLPPCLAGWSDCCHHGYFPKMWQFKGTVSWDLLVLVFQSNSFSWFHERYSWTILISAEYLIKRRSL